MPFLDLMHSMWYFQQDTGIKRRIGFIVWRIKIITYEIMEWTSSLYASCYEFAANVTASGGFLSYCFYTYNNTRVCGGTSKIQRIILVFIIYAYV